MHTRFSASQSVQLTVPNQPIPIQHYLRQPQRLVNALVDPSRIEQLGADRFRLKMRPLNFMMLSIQPTVDMRIWAGADGVIHLQSVSCDIRGVEYINQRFSLNLVGRLVPDQIDGETRLTGKADLEVEVDLPPAFRLTPKSLLEATGNGLLRSVLLTIKQRLMHQLLSDYHRWAMVQLEGAEPRPLEQPSLSPQSPTA
ncbi:DUF1997 domain-containing protein [Oculatella sp. LEGE 06141]|uniref:DUF1997 domain-containing protein n=1 Tax=Oculatella sp. LEGE 06141 TaxID=1828648 RepID=UPI00188064AA|nr:DUF1997 domain-containing protein [Oculatella sp. LEGE 06141]MBE9180780.1 DUF1997 domain-containing protein [Oculatella sp. LEGE 06141]